MKGAYYYYLDGLYTRTYADTHIPHINTCTHTFTHHTTHTHNLRTHTRTSTHAHIQVSRWTSLTYSSVALRLRDNNFRSNDGIVIIQLLIVSRIAFVVIIILHTIVTAMAEINYVFIVSCDTPAYAPSTQQELTKRHTRTYGHYSHTCTTHAINASQ